MRLFIRTSLFVTLLLSPATLARAQAPVDPSGHWVGVVRVPDRPINIEVDLAKNPAGALIGSFAQPAQGVKALPISAVTARDRTVGFVVKASAQSSTFTGIIAADGKTMTGEVTLGEYVVPFDLERLGDARMAAAPKSPPIDNELEGVWYGAIGGSLRVILKMANHPDGTAMGTIASPDGVDQEMPIAIRQSGTRVTIEVDAVGGRFDGELNVSTGELAGTWSQASASLPLALTRAKP